MSTLLGKKLLNYRIEKLLGQGGMGEVYLGVHTEIGRKVAIKVISPHLARDPRIQDRFKREALILAKLNHPNIVQLYDYWSRPEEGLFLIMEYVEGISLDRYIHRVLRGPVPPKQAIELFLQILDAFQYAHDNGVIHRDIKPSNILLRSDNVVKILDFGIARIVSPDPTTTSGDESSLTKTGTTLGTVSYMSPEQLRAKHSSDIDHRSDIYSLGVVLFEMLTGRELYDRSQLSEFEILIKIASEPPPPLSEINPKIAPDFEPILKKALAKKREERYQSCQEFAAALLHILPKYDVPQEVPPVKNPALTQTSASPLYASKEAPAKEKSQPQGSSRLRLLQIAGASLLLLGIGGGVFWYMRAQAAAKANALALADSFAVALHRHDEALLRRILAPSLTPFFSDGQMSQQAALEKYFLSFWKTLRRDSVAWSSPLEYRKENGQTFVEGTLYQNSYPIPQTTVVYEPIPRAQRIPGLSPPHRPVVREVPTPPICKVKRLRLYISEDKISGVRVLEAKDCPK
ncbi:MAG: serine/threonine protein kinase [Bacteroidia bacterium]|nr:serine/threonine protein kinase [Bacteroidia bacterium]